LFIVEYGEEERAACTGNGRNKRLLYDASEFLMLRVFHILVVEGVNIFMSEVLEYINVVRLQVIIIGGLNILMRGILDMLM
jgi:hypothetical protein